MLHHADFGLNPIALQLGPLSIHWYGLMYMAAFVAFMLLARWRIRQGQAPGWSGEAVDDLLFYGALGVVLGGRLGQVLFYDPVYFFSHPLEIFAVWNGGMSFHGGFLGVLVAMAWYGHKTGRSFWQVTDFIAPLVPPGLFAGRIGNFINGELWGRVCDPDLPWGMVFRGAGDLPRHPSQLYQAGMEGLLLFFILWRFTSKPRPVRAASGLFLLGYGVFRWIGEYFREPDHGIFGQSYAVSMGQWLSLPMILLGVFFLFNAYRKEQS
ncbi:MAG: prolipoprotein diacylglyceryl transferase [Zoogloea sp.]|uniref:prolipoprotein diacylglyceryl transferase n=1 Tax=Zoogloea sp. TaxID=49181 RepID=UPI003F374B30